MQDWVSCGLHPPIAGNGVELANTLTGTAIEPNAGGFVVPKMGDANSFFVGQRWSFYARGRYQTSGTTPTLKLGLYYGGAAGVKLAESAAVSTINTVTVNWPWELLLNMKVMAVGGSGAGILWAYGHLIMPASLTTCQAPYPLDATANATDVGTTVDMSTAKALSIVATWGTAATTNKVMCHDFVPLQLN